VDHGRVIAEGTPGELKSKMGATVLELVMEDEESAAEAAKALDRLADQAPTLEGTRVSVPVDDGASLLTRALRSLDRRKLTPAKVSLREPSLDDVFLALTGHTAEDADTEVVA
ncbi:MAG TPA: DUF4162 domain-containing protein, partial [Acidimicrobiales bacterium]|nr:DUF4162 domain-containing protein [Acidimicrobiales bacterium]